MEQIKQIEQIEQITSDIIFDTDTKVIILVCPHCKDIVIIEQLNCCIFRHSVLKSDNTEIPPHASKDECDNYIKNNLIYGCGKPFQIIKKSADLAKITELAEITESTDFNNMEVIICDYI
jgi:hypothetical protein